MANNVSVNVKIEGMDKLLRKMEKAKGGEYVRAALRVGGERVRDEAGKYPPSSEANNPSNKRWYERGFGTKYRTSAGSVVGKKTSEDLKKHWYVKPDNASVTVGNKVKYAHWVHGDEQAAFHGKRGWKKLKETAKDLSDEILKDIEAAFLQMWDRAK